eukprot:115772_1
MFAVKENPRESEAMGFIEEDEAKEEAEQYLRQPLDWCLLWAYIYHTIWVLCCRSKQRYQRATAEDWTVQRHYVFIEYNALTRIKMVAICVWNGYRIPIIRTTSFQK